MFVLQEDSEFIVIGFSCHINFCPIGLILGKERQCLKVVNKIIIRMEYLRLYPLKIVIRQIGEEQRLGSVSAVLHISFTTC